MPTINNRTPMNDNPQALALFEPQNVQTLAQLAPRSYRENQLSNSRCLDAGRALLARVQQQGMSDALDIDIAKYIDKAKATVKMMNSKRSPVTQLFDRLRKEYTRLEQESDPSKPDSIPGQLQAARNAYAQKKLEEENRRRLAEARRLAKENAIARYRADVEDDYKQQFTALVNASLNNLASLDRSLSLENYEASVYALKAFPCELPASWCQTVSSSALRPAELAPDECRAIQASAMAALAAGFAEQFPFEVQSARDELLDRLPSKRRELERIAKASADEAARIKAEMEAREAAERARAAAERAEREKQEAAAAQLAAQKQEMDGLFGAPVAPTAAYQPKTQVKKKAVITSAEDIMRVVAFWWSQEGCAKSLDELCKEFKKQITFANAAANSKDAPTFIDGIQYEDEVKAK